MTLIEVNKKIQREIALNKRKKLFKKNYISSKKIIDNFKNLNEFNESKIIASFISIKTEISTNLLNEFILRNKKKLCLPVIDKFKNHLIFKEYDLYTKLVKGKFGILEPERTKKKLIPQIILTPCLAFDSKGYRLGYGGGYYDKLFTELKKNNLKFISIAVAFEGQKIKEVASDTFDQKINYILTEKNLYKA